jgi:hypothetical protein
MIVRLIRDRRSHSHNSLESDCILWSLQIFRNPNGQDGTTSNVAHRVFIVSAYSRLFDETSSIPFAFSWRPVHSISLTSILEPSFCECRPPSSFNWFVSSIWRVDHLLIKRKKLLSGDLRWSCGFDQESQKASMRPSVSRSLLEMVCDFVQILRWK